MNNLWFFLLAGFGSWCLTGFFRRYATAKQLMDIPNARSSHSNPTPRGGGVAIVIVFLLGLWVLVFKAMLPWAAFWGLLGASAGVALLGFLDDQGHIPARWRLLGHFCAAIWGLAWLGGMPPWIFDWGWFGTILTAIYLVWMLNLYNFMDGIDGLASIEALSVSLGGILLMLPLSDHLGDCSVLLLLAVAVAGFLVWSFSPAKIFMGDAGSGFLGLVLGLSSVQAAWIAPPFFWSWLILLGVFIVDATWTLLRRFMRGEKVYEAHRSHAYQNASRHYGSHKMVSLAIAAINVCWLMPIALCVGLAELNVLLGLALAYAPLIALAVYFRAGGSELA